MTPRRFHRRLARAPAIALATLLAACSTPATRVVLLPQEDGRTSAVVVQSEGGAQTLAAPYQRATAPVGSNAAPKVDTADPAELRRDNALLFELRPARPADYTLYFDAGGTVLTAESQSALEQMLNAALARPGADLVVTGHTDTRGAGAQNDGLSQRRAEEIRQMLVQRGFPAARIEAVGRGERDLAVNTADEVDEPRNRRVTIELR